MARRIVNIVNFLRYDEPRMPMDLFTPLVEQMRLLKEAGLPATWLLQYDALAAGPYVEFLKKEMPSTHEAGLWFEINRMHCNAAGVEFHGEANLNWDYHAQASLSAGYTPAEREKLADAAMNRFHEIFGSHPRSVAAWYIDAHTLGYLFDKYRITASANCKDQFGTDGYTLWGAPYAGGYYPSRTNAMVPGSSNESQIPLPIFRMLGTDPIHQYDLDLGAAKQTVLSLEPVYGNGGADPAWVDRFLDIIAFTPPLAFAYAQAGQENSFGWDAMQVGYRMQVEKLKERRARGEFELECLGDTGAWFQKTFPTSPALAVTALTDTLGGKRRSIWYSSRFYRLNLLLQDDSIRVRDIHVYRDGYGERHLVEPCTQHAAVFDALPILDGLQWSTKDHRAWGTPMLMHGGRIEYPLRAASNPTVEESGSALRITFPLTDGGTLTVLCEEEQCVMWLAGRADADGLGLEFRWAPETKTSFDRVDGSALHYEHNSFAYSAALINASAQATRKGFMLTAAGARMGLRLSQE